MKETSLPAINAIGFGVRTSNNAELEPNTAKIGPLWERFYAEVGPLLNESSKVYGVYTNYESDANAPYDLVACVDGVEQSAIKNATKVEIQAGKYLMFSAKGEMPQTVINLWQEIWNFFEAEGCPYKRAYATDFEFYKSGDEVEVSIGVLG